MKKMLLMLLPTLLMSGCLVMETHHTLYLNQNGEVDWTVLVTDVHSDLDIPKERSDEETQFQLESSSSQYRISQALSILEPFQLENRVLRDHQPFTVWTEARFTYIDVLARNVINRLQIPGQARLWRENDQTHFELLCYPGLAPQNDSNEQNALLPLVEDLENYRIVLPAGHFIEAQGFRVESGGRVAIPEEQANDDEEERPFVLALSWSDDNPQQ